MAEKDTTQLENELREADDLKKFDEENAENFRQFTFKEYLLHLLKEKNLTRAQVIKDSHLGEYAHHFFNVNSPKKSTSRENVLSLAVAMKLSPKETDYLLYYAGHKKLYVRDRWDQVIFYALENGDDILITNELLTDMNLLPLLGKFD